MSAIKVVIVDCEKAGLINGPFWVLVVRGEKLAASTSGVDTLERAETIKANYVEQFAYHCRCCGEVCEDGADCCTDDFPEPGDLREWA